MTTDSFVVKPLRVPRRVDRRAGRQRHGERPRDGRRAPAGADARAHPRGGPAGRRAARPRSRPSPTAAQAADVSDRRRRHQGRRPRPGRRHVPLHHRHRPHRRPRAELSPAALRPGDRILVSGPIGAARHGDHARARGVRARRRGRVRHAAAVARGRRDARGRPAPACAACATPRAAAWRPSSTSSRAPPAWRCSSARRPCRCRPSSPERRSCSASTRCTSPTRACSWRSSRSRARRGGARRAARRLDGFGEAAEIGEVKTEPPGVVLVETAFGGRRVMDQLVGDPLPRIC